MEYMLPIGTIVKIKNVTGYKMIIGFGQVKNNKLYDYVSCDYKTGTKSNNLTFFNENEIQQIIYIGYQNEESIFFQKTFYMYINEIKEFFHDEYSYDKIKEFSKDCKLKLSKEGKEKWEKVLSLWEL